MTNTLSPHFSDSLEKSHETQYHIPGLEEKIETIRSIKKQHLLIKWLYHSLSTIGFEEFNLWLIKGNSCYELEKFGLFNLILPRETENVVNKDCTRSDNSGKALIPTITWSFIELANPPSVIVKCSLPLIDVDECQLYIELRTPIDKRQLPGIQQIYVPQLYYLLTNWLDQMIYLNHTRTSSQPKLDLTQRELDVLKEFSLGKSIKEVSLSLNISINTVCSHSKNLYRKLGVNSRQKAMMAYQNALK